jgi:hypothetical protein
MMKNEMESSSYFQTQLGDIKGFFVCMYDDSKSHKNIQIEMERLLRKIIIHTENKASSPRTPSSVHIP